MDKEMGHVRCSVCKEYIESIQFSNTTRISFGNLRQRPTVYQHVDRLTYVLTKQM